MDFGVFQLTEVLGHQPHCTFHVLKFLYGNLDVILSNQLWSQLSPVVEFQTLECWSSDIFHSGGQSHWANILAS